MKANRIIIPVIAVALCCAAACILIHSRNKAYSENFTGYDDCISFIVEGYQLHWDGVSPEDFDISYIYRYASPSAGFLKYDINGDGVEELLLGDQFDDGAYEIYDIFTFNRRNGEMVHLFCGGERDRCVVNVDGVIIENGSNSAFESVSKNFVIRSLKLKELPDGQAVSEELLPLKFDKFINYAEPQDGPEMKVIVGTDGKVGRYVDEDETSYIGEIQDEYRISKDAAHTEIVRATDARGILTLKEPGTCPVRIAPDAASEQMGTMVHKQGFVPEVYRCLGYAKGWFLTEIDGKTGYVQEEFVNWDAINTF